MCRSLYGKEGREENPEPAKKHIRQYMEMHERIVDVVSCCMLAERQM